METLEFIQIDVFSVSIREYRQLDILIKTDLNITANIWSFSFFGSLLWEEAIDIKLCLIQEYTQVVHNEGIVVWFIDVLEEIIKY